MPLIVHNSCSFGKQLWVLMHRSYLSQLRNPADTAARLLISSWMGIMAGERVLPSWDVLSLHGQCHRWNIQSQHLPRLSLNDLSPFKGTEKLTASPEKACMLHLLVRPPTSHAYEAPKAGNQAAHLMTCRPGFLGSTYR